MHLCLFSANQKNYLRATTIPRDLTGYNKNWNTFGVRGYYSSESFAPAPIDLFLLSTRADSCTEDSYR